jgi:HxlR-like helix-turn-helix protein
MRPQPYSCGLEAALETDGLIVRTDFREMPPRVAYSLGAHGVSLTAAMLPLCEWGSEHMARIETLKDHAWHAAEGPIDPVGQPCPGARLTR